jgi:glycosyltransferase involved in cell wall biosynthesis
MDYLADVMRKVTQLDTRVRFVVAGEFGWRARVEQRFRELGLAERITFAGHVQDMPAFYARCDVVLMTSRTRSIEGSPNALLEAMAMEKPVVATAVGGIPELIEHGVNGYLAAADDTTAFSRYVLELLEFRERRESMGRAARRTVIERFSQDVAVQKTAEVIEGVLAATLNRGREGAGPGPEARVPGTAPRPHGALASGLDAKRR